MLDFRYNISLKKITPYAWANGGFLFNVEDFKDNRTFVNPGFGARYAFNRKLALNGGAGMWFQHGLTRDSFINFRVGLVFKPL
jgi:hypothetical protein